MEEWAISKLLGENRTREGIANHKESHEILIIKE
jgi:hypothetical protein